MSDLILPEFGGLAAMVGQTVAESSRRVYADTYRQWEMWAVEQNLSPLDLHPLHIEQFLKTGRTENTRKRMLSVMRKLVTFAAVVEPRFALYKEVLEDMRVPKDGLTGATRSKKALSPDEMRHIFQHVWVGEDLISVRNDALIKCLLSLWVRRSEIAALRWEDINFETKTAYIRNGKGGKAREVAVVGDYALDALYRWFDDLHRASKASIVRQFVFCGINPDGTVGRDGPILGNTVGKVVRRTSELAGIPFRAHDLRRSAITEAIRQGSNLKDVQAQAGHVRESTTLLYVQAVSAEERATTLKSRFTS